MSTDSDVLDDLKEALAELIKTAPSTRRESDRLKIDLLRRAIAEIDHLRIAVGRHTADKINGAKAAK